MTSHAAVVARGMGTCCVAGCGDIKVNEEEKNFRSRWQSIYMKVISYPLMEPLVMYMEELLKQ